MTVIASPDLIAKLDHVLRAGSPDLRTRMLQEVAGMFLDDAHRLSAHHVEMFDGILVRLTESVELRTLTTLSRSLADLRLVPLELARRLANHDDADVAAPILRKCECLPDADLIDIAWMRAEGHLCAIAGRKAVNAELTDILLMRGDSSVLRVLARNPGADLTSAGLAMMVDAAERDDDIADGLISRKSVELGQMVQVGQPLLAIVPLHDVWVLANFKETQLGRVRAGMTALVEIDTFPGKVFQGKVDSISAGTGARFSLLPPENATGNWVKVVQRVPVKIRLDAKDFGNPHTLRAGMSAVVTVRVK